MLPTMTHTNYSHVLCPAKKQPSWCHRQSTSPNLISSYGDIVIWLCYQPWAHMSHSQIDFLINKQPSRFHWRTFQFAHTNNSRIPCHSNKQPSRYYRQFSYPNLMSPSGDIVIWVCSQSWPIRTIRVYPVPPKSSPRDIIDSLPPRI